MNEPEKGAGRAPRKKQKFEPYKVRIGGRTMWQVNLESRTVQRDGRSIRIRPRRTFANVAEARTFADLRRIERRNHSTLTATMPEELRHDALHAAQILRPCGLSLSEAARAVVQADQILRPLGVCLLEAARECAARRELSQKSETVQNAVAAFIKAKETDRARNRYLEDLRSRLGRFSRDFAECKVSDLTAAELDDWLRDLAQSPLSRNTYHLRIHTLLEYCRTRGWLAFNPLKDVPKARVAHDGAIGILSVDQVARLLENADSGTLPYWLFAIFCGLRSAELRRLEWRDVHWDEHLIEVPSAKSKTASRRFVQLRPNLLQWLGPYRDKGGPICPRSLDERLVADRKAAGITTWPANACRHSFASYHLAHFRDPRELALEMGHTRSEVTFRHYRELVRPAEAERFWRLVPAIASGPKIAVVA
jgi:integrase